MEVEPSKVRQVLTVDRVARTMHLGRESSVPVRALALSAIVGWLAYTTADAVHFFFAPHGKSFAPEIGPAATFIFFSAIFTLFYVVQFLVVAVPAMLVLDKLEKFRRLSQRALLGAALFAASIFLGTFIAAGFGVLIESNDFWLAVSLSSIAGFAAFLAFALISRRREEKKGIA